MNREEFILTLRKELSKLPPEEIVEATQYFEEIFIDATEGLEEEARLAEEQRLVEEFGNPKKIAAQIRADYAARLLDGDETILDKKPGAKKKLSALWWVIIGICSAPVSIPIVGCLICLAIGVICFMIGIYAGIIGCGVGAIGAIVMGCIFLSSSVPSGVMTIGAGLVLLALSAAAAVGAFIGTKAMVKGIARTVREKNEQRRKKKLYRMGQDGPKEEEMWVRVDEEPVEQEEAAEPFHLEGGDQE